MDHFTQLTLVVGRLTPDHVQMLGTGFLVSSNGQILTTHHVIGNNVDKLVVIMPHISQINQYQDLSDTRCSTAPVTVLEVDPIHDLCLLKSDIPFSGSTIPLGTFDNCDVGEELQIFGYPHCTEGRRAFTYQRTELGAKVLLNVSGLKSKHAVINTQARPGQSGSMVYSPKTKSISGILVGAWIPGVGGISLGGINPRELHQTTHCVSAEYVLDML